MISCEENQARAREETHLQFTNGLKKLSGRSLRKIIRKIHLISGVGADHQQIFMSSHVFTVVASARVQNANLE